MKTNSVYYRFSSEKKRFCINFNTTEISLLDITKEIIRRRNMKGAPEEFEFLFYDENKELIEDKNKKIKPLKLLTIKRVPKYKVDNSGFVEIIRDPKDIPLAKVKPKKQVKGLMEIWDLPKHIAEHIYMFSGETVKVEIKTTKDMVSDFENRLARSGLTLDEIPCGKYGTLDKYVPGGDYVVIKFARWAFEKFKGVEDKLGTQMRAVGEVMSIGKNYKEAFQKAIRSLEIVVFFITVLQIGHFSLSIKTMQP